MTRLPTDEEVAAAFDRNGPWFTRFRRGDASWGGRYDVAGDARPALFARELARWSGVGRPEGPTPEGRGLRLLELGSLEGGHTLLLAGLPGVAEVVGVEGRAESVRRAQVVRGLLRADNVRFVEADLEDFDLSLLGRFDACFCVGILYHLTAPWDLLRGLALVTDRLFLWTHLAARAEVAAGGWPGRWHPEGGPGDVLAGLRPRSFWPTRDGLLRMLEDAGWRDAMVLGDDPTHPGGAAITLTAEAGERWEGAS